MGPLLTGLETEYGFAVEGRGAQDQVDDAIMLVRSCPDEHFAGWDYRFESPRSDLRGVKVDRLNFDPEDAKFDAGRQHGSDEDVRSDRVLTNGARFYNDHGHPEYSTPECWSLEELALHDIAGETLLLRTAQVFTEKTGRTVKLFKNNTDGHGASYGTHENYLCPRSLGFERLYKAVVPMLVARTVVCGAGKVGAETGTHCDYQMSQRADFFTEPFSVDTLYRRPIFNTRDEPHADASQWIRLHVISGDANRIARCTQTKVALVKTAIWLEEIERAPKWDLQNPMRAFQMVSRDLTANGRIELSNGSWTTPRHVIESYVEAGERFLDCSSKSVCETLALARESLELLDDWIQGGERLTRTADWAAKLRMLQNYLDDSGGDWSDPALKSYDLAYHDIDPAEGLFAAMVELDMIEPQPSLSAAQERLTSVPEGTRALPRGIAVEKFKDALVSICWANMTFESDGRRRNIALRPDVVYPRSLQDATTLDAFLQELEAVT